MTYHLSETSGNNNQRGPQKMSDSDNKKPDASKQAQDQRRRGVVKGGVALGIGGVTLSQWSKPVVETVVLPAHAQTSPGGGRIRGAGSGANTVPIGGGA